MKKIEFSLQKENDLFFVGLCYSTIKTVDQNLVKKTNTKNGKDEKNPSSVLESLTKKNRRYDFHFNAIHYTLFV
jgi:hypothetical protein